MYKIDKTVNRIAALEEKSFSELGFNERCHLQEWLAHTPEALGEELLIIQKEFDGFDDTRERLDLLALDKDGNLVIIENKLDDSGRDVAWQALKYAGYCSNLSKNQIVDIYQLFLVAEAGATGTSPVDAKKSIVEFMEAADFDEITLNRSQSQRVMFVAAKFRKEVTNTVLWLIGHGISCQCFKVTPFVSGAELFLNVEQILPTPESAEFMIGMAAKEAEEKAIGKEVKKRFRLRLAFWEKMLEELKNSDCNLFDNINPGKDHWISAGSGVRSMPYSLVFGKKIARVELYLSRPAEEVNSFVFKELYAKKDAIENSFGDSLDWQSLPGKKACRIAFEKPFDGFDEQNWPDMIEWFKEHIIRFEAALKDHLIEVNKKLKEGAPNFVSTQIK